jgi:hypothetical protein
MSDNPSESPKSNKGMIIVIIALSFLFFIGIGIVLYFLFGKKLFNPAPPPSPVNPAPSPRPPPSPPSGGTGATGGTGGTGATGATGGTGGTTPVPPIPPMNPNTYLFIREYGLTPYPSYLSVRTINDKKYLVPNYMATPENSLFRIDSSGGLMFTDTNLNTFRNISVNRTTSEINFVDISDSSANILMDRVYLAPSSDSIFELKYNSGILSIIPLASDTSYNVFGSSSVANFTFVKRDQLNPIRPLYFSLSNDPALSPKYLSFLKDTSSLVGTSFCYLNYDGKQIYDPNCQFYLDMSTFMLMKNTSLNEYQYVSSDPYVSDVPQKFSLTKEVKKDNVKFVAPDRLIFDLNFYEGYIPKNICTNLNEELGRNTISDTLNLNNQGLDGNQRVCNLGGFTQNPSPTSYVDLYSFSKNDNGEYLRIKNITDLALPYLILSPSSTEIPDKYYIKDALSFIMIFKDNQFKYINLDESSGGYRLSYSPAPSTNTLKLKPTATKGEYTIINGNDRCLVYKTKSVNLVTFSYLGFRTSTEPCIIFKIAER